MCDYRSRVLLLYLQESKGICVKKKKRKKKKMLERNLSLQLWTLPCLLPRYNTFPNLITKKMHIIISP